MPRTTTQLPPSKEVLDGDTIDDESQRTRDDLAEDTVVDQMRDPSTVMNPVLVDGDDNIIWERTSNFIADADWDRNPAAEWTTDPALMGATENMDDDEADIWTNYFQMTQTPGAVAGPCTSTCVRTSRPVFHGRWVQPLTIARGPGSDEGDPAQVRVDWDDIVGLRNRPAGGEINLAGYDAAEVPAAGQMVEGDGRFVHGRQEAGSPVWMEAPAGMMARASAGSTTTRTA